MEASNKKIVAGILGIVLGSLGIHKFYLGYTTAGIIMLLITVLSKGYGASVMGLIGLIEGIIYLTKSDSDFYNTYIANKKEWL
jgi:TM2 domain-containing membrane protein YozV